jgi:hypothetical protein
MCYGVWVREKQGMMRRLVSLWLRTGLGKHHPRPLLAGGGEPYPGNPRTGKSGNNAGTFVRNGHLSASCSRWLQFPSFLQGGDRGGSTSSNAYFYKHHTKIYKLKARLAPGKCIHTAPSRAAIVRSEPVILTKLPPQGTATTSSLPQNRWRKHMPYLWSHIVLAAK